MTTTYTKIAAAIDQMIEETLNNSDCPTGWEKLEAALNEFKLEILNSAGVKIK